MFSVRWNESVREWETFEQAVDYARRKAAHGGEYRVFEGELLKRVLIGDAATGEVIHVDAPPGEIEAGLRDLNTPFVPRPGDAPAELPRPVSRSAARPRSGPVPPPPPPGGEEDGDTPF